MERRRYLVCRPATTNQPTCGRGRCHTFFTAGKRASAPAAARYGQMWSNAMSLHFAAMSTPSHSAPDLAGYRLLSRAVRKLGLAGSVALLTVLGIALTVGVTEAGF